MFFIDESNLTVTVGNEPIYYGNMTHVSIQYLDYESYLRFHIKNSSEIDILVDPTEDAVTFCNHLNEILKKRNGPLV